MSRYSYVGEIVAYEPDGNGEDVEGGLDSLRHALFRCSQPVSLRSVFWRPYFYATCQVSLPRQWEVATNDDVSSQALPWNGEVMCTHCASLCGAYTLRRSYVFNHPFELHLDQKEVDQTSAEPVPPRLIFQVLQVDGWERHFLEGYTFIDLPREPGSYTLHGRLWAPRGSLSERLSASFCGAFVPLASPDLVASDEHQLPRNRSGLAVTSAGSLQLRVQVLKHSAVSERKGREARRSFRRRDRTSRGRSGSLERSPSPSRSGSLEGLRRRNLRAAAEPSPRLH
ncbi:unnamed protein product [Durusdinium trenchii]|uniref:B9 domain-containing protein 2 n=2 Tax=Durusdinium trenchii TaxID=1381693 RepID=A0ABP0S0B0_9DINO